MDKKTKVLVFVLSFIVAFIVYTIAYYSYKGWQWDAIFPYILDWGEIVGATSGVLGVTEIISNAFGNKQCDEPVPMEPQEEIISEPIQYEEPKKRRRIMACKGGKKRK